MALAAVRAPRMMDQRAASVEPHRDMWANLPPRAASSEPGLDPRENVLVDRSDFGYGTMLLNDKGVQMGSPPAPQSGYILSGMMQKQNERATAVLKR